MEKKKGKIEIKEIEKKGQFIKVINQKNQGVVSSRNNAIRMAKGTYIFPLDGDDKIAPTCLSQLYEAIINNRGDVIYSGGMYFGNVSGPLELMKPTKLNMCIGNRVCVSALYRKEDWVKYGGYDEIMNEGLEDWEFWLNFVKENKTFYKVEEPLFFYRKLAISRNSIINEQEYKKLIKIIREKHKKLYDWRFKISVLFSKIGNFLYRKKINKSGKVIVKICKIPMPISFFKGKKR